MTGNAVPNGGRSQTKGVGVLIRRVGVSALGEKFAIGVVVTVLALAVCAPAQADNDQDQRFLAALTSAGWSIHNASGLISQGRQVCVEGLAHGVTWQEIRSTLMGSGYSSLDSSTLITQAVTAYCPDRRSAIAGMDSGSRTAGPSSNDEWWDTPSMGKSMCTMVKVNGRDWAASYGIGDFNGTAQGAHIVDDLIAKYCPQFGH